MNTEQVEEKSGIKPAAIVGLLVILGALAFGANAFVTNLTPYVTFKVAREAKGTVQVMGKLDKESVANSEKELRFVLVSEEGERLPVSFTATKPANFSMATQITAIGTYDGAVFRAKNLLVKCPTKYQGKESEKTYSADSRVN
ncbi:MAG: cytochrome c maturation protein CcmE [Capsulimonadales bacterium]|nr:cytochrome c maturation protein CcmE [Capsulimonadales bacterium]